MLSFDCFRDSDGRLILIVSGAVDAPVVHDEDSGQSVTLAPAKIDFSGIAPTIVSATPDTANGWMGEPPHPPTDAELRVEIDGRSFHAVCRWPEQATVH